jgi:hypothetical protein
MQVSEEETARARISMFCFLDVRSRERCSQVCACTRKGQVHTGR